MPAPQVYRIVFSLFSSTKLMMESVVDCCDMAAAWLRRAGARAGAAAGGSATASTPPGSNLKNLARSSVAVRDAMPDGVRNSLKSAAAACSKASGRRLQGLESWGRGE